MSSPGVVVDLTDEAQGSQEFQEVIIFVQQRYQEIQQQILQMQQSLQEEEKEQERSSEDKLLHDFILDKHKIELRSDAVYRAVMACCGTSLSGEVPSSMDIAYEILTQKMCACFNGQNLNAVIMATEHALLNHSTTNCPVIARILMFHTSEHRYPTTLELEQVQTRLSMALDPAQGEPAKQPCPGLENLKSQKAKKKVPQGCCICQSDISRGSKMIKLTPCGHIFHDKTRDCDGIRPWLQNNKTCPICIKNVEIV